MYKRYTCPTTLQIFDLGMECQSTPLTFKCADISLIIKRPLWDACLYMGEATPPDPPDPPDPHFLFAIALQP